MTRLGAVWVVGAALYLLFAGSLRVDELFAAAACALAVSLWSGAVARVGRVHMRFERAAPKQCLHAVCALPRATLRTAAALVSALAHGGQGEVGVRPLARGRLGDPVAAGRRAVAVLCGSLAPDCFVVRTPLRRNGMVVHALGSHPT